MQLRPAQPADFPAILALNAESVRHLSPLDAERLAQLHAQADLHTVVERDGQVVAFLLALREGRPYDSVNYRWFAERYPRFLYIDRVVVSLAAQSQGVGRLLYEDTLARAARQQLPVTCEYDLEPPNPRSAAFHARFGFREVGRQLTTGGRKRMSLQVRDDAACPSPS